MKTPEHLVNANEFVRKTVKRLRKTLYSARPHICSDVAFWGRFRGLHVLDVHPPIYDEVFQFGHEDEQAKKVVEFHQAEYRQPQSLVTIPKARVRDSVGLVFLPDGAVCEQGTWFPPYLTEHPAYQARFRRKRHIDGDVFSLLGMFSAEFYHWFHDTLPRLQNCLPHLLPQTKFLIHSRPRDYQIESLAALGIPQNRLEYQPDRGDTVIERLWFSTPSGNAVFGAADTLWQVASQIKTACGVGAVSGEQRIYISRRKARRRVLNEPEIEPFLKNNGFQIVVMEDLSFRQQVQLCANANILIGAHGAGLSNLMYCSSKSKIGEIVQAGVHPFYLGLSRQFGFAFHRYLALQQAQGDLVVDMEEFHNWLDALCKSDNSATPVSDSTLAD